MGRKERGREGRREEGKKEGRKDERKEGRKESSNLNHREKVMSRVSGICGTITITFVSSQFQEERYR
jgi:hypothetical protein